MTPIVLALMGALIAAIGLYFEMPLLAFAMKGRSDDSADEASSESEHVIPPGAQLWGSPLGLVPVAGARKLRDPRSDPEFSRQSSFWPQALAFQVLMAVVFAVLAVKFHSPTHLAVATIYVTLLYEMAIVDFHHRLVLNVLSYPSAAIAVLTAALWSGVGLDKALIGGAIALAVFVVIEVMGKGAMGRGDTKLAAVIGLMRGFPAVLSALVAGILVGGLMALTLVLRGQGRKATFAYGPALAIGCLISIMAGHS